MKPKPPSRRGAAVAATLLMAQPLFAVADSAAAPYTSARITAPADGEGLRANSGDFVVHAQIEPALRPGHSLQLLLNGDTQGKTQASSMFQLTGIERGEHRLRLRILNDQGSVVFEGEPSIFHLLRHSRLHPRPAANP